MNRQLLLNLLRGGNTSESNEELVASLKTSGAFSNPRVEDALLKIPRGEFVSEDLRDEAYIDTPIRVASMGFNISAPHMYAVCLETLNIEPGMSFLDIGSGCGHFTALGAYLAGKEGVSHGLEIRQDIVDFSETNVKKFSEKSGIDLNNCKFFVRNCFLPVFNSLKYDRIHVGACCPEKLLPQLVELLKVNGSLVTPLLDKIVKVTRLDDSHPPNFKVEAKMSVRYGDLIIPSDAEMKEAQRQVERQKRTTIVIPDSKFSEDFSQLINEPNSSDVKFIVENRPIFAHRRVLAARSEHFRGMLFGGLKESNEFEIPLVGIRYSPFIDCLHYIYTGNVVIRDPDHAVEILELANYLKLDHLKAMCENDIKDTIEIETAAYLLQIACRCEALQLKSFTIDYIIFNYDDVSKTKTFDDLDKQTVLEVTRESCKLLQKALM